MLSFIWSPLGLHLVNIQPLSRDWVVPRQITTFYVIVIIMLAMRLNKFIDSLEKLLNLAVHLQEMVSKTAQGVFHHLYCTNITVCESVPSEAGCWIAVVKSVSNVIHHVLGA